MLQIELKEGVDIRHVVREDRVVHAPRAHRAARHQETVLHRPAHIAGQLCGEGRVSDIVEAVAAAAVGKDGDLPLGAEKPRREEHRVRAAGDVQGAVRVLLHDAAEELTHGLGVEDAGPHEDELHVQSAVFEVGAELALDLLVGGHFVRADIDHLCRAEHLHAQDVFERSVVIQFDQRLHLIGSLRRFSLFYSECCFNTSA